MRAISIHVDKHLQDGIHPFDCISQVRIFVYNQHYLLARRPLEYEPQRFLNAIKRGAWNIERLRHDISEALYIQSLRGLSALVIDCPDVNLPKAVQQQLTLANAATAINERGILGIVSKYTEEPLLLVLPANKAHFSSLHVTQYF